MSARSSPTLDSHARNGPADAAPQGHRDGLVHDRQALRAELGLQLCSAWHSACQRGSRRDADEDESV